MFVAVDPNRRWSGARLREAREHAGLSLAQLAAAVETSEVTCWRWERNHTTPSIAHVLRILAQLECGLDALTEAIPAADDAA